MKVDRLWKDILSACFFCKPYFTAVSARSCLVASKAWNTETTSATCFLKAEPFLHCFIAGGAGNCRWWSGQLLLQNFFSGSFCSLGWQGRASGARAVLSCSWLLLRSFKAISASCSFLLAFANSALSGLWELDATGAGAWALIVETTSPSKGCMNLADSLCLSGGAGPCVLAATASKSIRSCLMWRSRFETKTASEMDRTKTMLWNRPLDKHRRLKSSRPIRVNSVTRRSAMFLPASQEQTTTGLKHLHSAPTIAKVAMFQTDGWFPVASHGCSNPTSCSCPKTNFP